MNVYFVHFVYFVYLFIFIIFIEVDSNEELATPTRKISKDVANVSQARYLRYFDVIRYFNF